MSRPSLLRRIFSAIWNGITRVRLALSNILFLVLIALIYFVYLGGGAKPLPERAALLLNIRGAIVDEKAQPQPLEALLGEPSPMEHEVLLRDVIDAIEYARDDPAINSMVIDLQYLASAGISKTQEIVVALQSFKDSGKPVVAVGDFYTQGKYLLASHADTVIVHPYGGVLLEGFSSYRNYFREALEKLSVSVHVFKAGDHKSIAEPFLRDDMSPEEKAITERWLQVLWREYARTVEAERDLERGAVDAYANNYAQLLAGQDGDSARLARRAGLADEVLNRDQVNDYLTELVGASNDEGKYESVPFESYVSRKRPGSLSGVTGDRVAIITAQGNIVPGEQPPGTIGGDSLAQLIQTTAEEEGVGAIVLRVNSGGGSVFASEVIRQQLLKARAGGMPVVVSMGAVAASGGYYIAAEADEIWATPGTVTGSIGVFAAFPTIDQLLQRMGVYTDGVGTTDIAGAMRMDRPLNPAVADAVRSGVSHIYERFIRIVADGRDLSREAVDELAEGRVWSAPDALEHGLIDSIGTLDDAVAAAAARAGLEDYEVEFVELPRSPRELLLQQLADRVGAVSRWTNSTAALAGLLTPVAEAAAEVAGLRDPRHLYMRCVACGIIR